MKMYDESEDEELPHDDKKEQEERFIPKEDDISYEIFTEMYGDMFEYVSLMRPPVVDDVEEKQPKTLDGLLQKLATAMNK